MYNIICYVLIYSFLGWIVEVIYAAFSYKRFVNRGFLNGPICPIYGVGAVGVIYLLDFVENNYLFLFIGGVILTSTVEFLTGFFLEKILKNKWWDYNDEKFNLCGYICLKFSLIWGFVCVLVIKVLQPIMEVIVNKTDSRFARIFIAIIVVMVITDIIETLRVIGRLNRRLAMMSELAKKLHELSDGMGAKVADGTFIILDKKDEFKQNFDEKRKEYNIILEKYEELIHNKFKGRRILKAFPTMKSSRYKDALSLLKKEISSLKKH